MLKLIKTVSFYLSTRQFDNSAAANIKNKISEKTIRINIFILLKMMPLSCSRMLFLSIPGMVLFLICLKTKEQQNSRCKQTSPCSQRRKQRSNKFKSHQHESETGSII